MKAVLILLSLSVQAIAQPTPAASAEAAKPARIEGRVLSAVSGEPVRRATVSLRPMGSRNFGPGPQMQPPYGATTGADGKFLLDAVEPGSYRLAAERPGYLRQEYGARRAGTQGITLTVTAGQHLKELEIRLALQSVITGKVTDEEGEPIERASVSALRWTYGRNGRQLQPMGGVLTNDLGEFRITGLRPGRYFLVARQMDRFIQRVRAQTDKQEEVRVPTYYPGVADSTAATPIEVISGQDVSSLEIRMRKAAAFRVSGKVVNDSGDPVRNVRIMLTRPEESGGGMMFGAASGTFVRDPRGAFEITGVLPGAYTLTVFSMDRGQPASARQQITVGSSDLDGVVVSMARGQELKGSLRVEGDARPDLSGVRVSLNPVEGLTMNTPNAPVKDGMFTLPAVGRDKYRVAVYNLPDSLYVKSVRYGDADGLNAALDLSDGAAGSLEILLSDAAGQIDGVVQNERKDPAPGSTVLLVPDPVNPHRTDLYKTASTDESGAFSVKGLAPGDYRVYAFDFVDSGAHYDPEFLKPYESKAAKVSVREKSRETAKLDLVIAEDKP